MAESNSELVVETSQLTKIYNNRQIALNDVTLRLEPGCVLGLLGSNGAGKTTLLRLIIGLHRPTAGWAKVFGKVMTPNSADLRNPSQWLMPAGERSNIIQNQMSGLRSAYFWASTSP